MSDDKRTTSIPAEILAEMFKQLYCFRAGVSLDDPAHAHRSVSFGGQIPENVSLSFDPGLAVMRSDRDNYVVMKIIERTSQLVAKNQLSAPVDMVELSGRSIDAPSFHAATPAASQHVVGDRNQPRVTRIKTTRVPAHLVRLAKPKQPMRVEWDQASEEIRQVLNKKNNPDHGDS